MRWKALLARAALEPDPSVRPVVGDQRRADQRPLQPAARGQAAGGEAGEPGGEHGDPGRAVMDALAADPQTPALEVDCHEAGPPVVRIGTSSTGLDVSLFRDGVVQRDSWLSGQSEV
jgi:hypothetical protein